MIIRPYITQQNCRGEKFFAQSVSLKTALLFLFPLYKTPFKTLYSTNYKKKRNKKQGKK